MAGPDASSPSPRPGVSRPDPDLLEAVADELESCVLAVSRRGYDREEVRSLLASVSAQLRQPVEADDCKRLAVELDTAAFTPTDDGYEAFAVRGVLGRAATRLHQAARTARTADGSGGRGRDRALDAPESLMELILHEIERVTVAAEEQAAARIESAEAQAALILSEAASQAAFIIANARSQAPEDPSAPSVPEMREERERLEEELIRLRAQVSHANETLRRLVRETIRLRANAAAEVAREMQSLRERRAGTGPSDHSVSPSAG